MDIRATILGGTAAMGVLLGLAVPEPARACGGFFCSQSAPVRQAAERILFVDHGDGTLSTVIQIDYTGPAERFAWVLPVPGAPDVQVSSTAAFDRLQAATEPVYRLQRRVEGLCQQIYYAAAAPSSSDSGGGSSSPPRSSSTPAPPPVTVVKEGSVGPYDYTVIALEPTLARPVDVAVRWLGDNGYDLTGLGEEVLAPYLDEGLNLLAFKLQKNSETGSIRPVVVKYAAERPSIPIRPTAVAAQDDMGVMVFVAGRTRAVPSNYLEVRLNEARINWFNYLVNYETVVSEAADEAGGQGFVTEFAGASQPLGQTIWTAADRELHSNWLYVDFSEDKGGLLRMLIAGYRNADGLTDALGETLPLPEGVSVQDVMACTGCQFPDEESLANLDPDLLKAAVAEYVVEPLRQTQVLVGSRPYLTRLYTTMSADEMTMDPVFHFNGDLGDHSNVHVAEQIIECDQDVLQNAAPWRIHLPQGDLVRGSGSRWPSGTASQPASRMLLRHGHSGLPLTITDESVAIADMLGDEARVEALQQDPVSGHALGTDHSGCAVATAPGSGRTPTALISLLAVALLWRRRHRARGPVGG